LILLVIIAAVILSIVRHFWAGSANEYFDGLISVYIMEKEDFNEDDHDRLRKQLLEDGHQPWTGIPEGVAYEAMIKDWLTEDNIDAAKEQVRGGDRSHGGAAVEGEGRARRGPRGVPPAEAPRRARTRVRRREPRGFRGLSQGARPDCR